MEEHPTALASSPEPGSVPLPGVSELLGEAWKIYQARFKTLLGLTAASMLSLVSIAMAFADAQAVGVSVAAVRVVAFAFALIPVFLWSRVALIVTIRDRSESVGFQEAFRRSRGLIWSYLFVSFLVGLVVLVGLILLVVPGILFAVWFAFAPIVLVVEGRRGKTALAQNRNYVRGRTAAVAWRLFAPGFLLTFGVLLIGILVGVPFIAAGGEVYVGVRVVDAVTDVIALILAPLFAAYFFLLYERVRGTQSARSATNDR